MLSPCENCQTNTYATTYKNFRFCWECYDHYREAEQQHPSYKAKSTDDPSLFRAIDKFDELLVYIKDKEQYFAKSKANVENVRDEEYDYYEGAEEAYSHLSTVVIKLKGDLLNV